MNKLHAVFPLLIFEGGGEATPSCTILNPTFGKMVWPLMDLDGQGHRTIKNGINFGGGGNPNLPHLAPQRRQNWDGVNWGWDESKLHKLLLKFGKFFKTIYWLLPTDEPLNSSIANLATWLDIETVKSSCKVNIQSKELIFRCCFMCLYNTMIRVNKYFEKYL